RAPSRSFRNGPRSPSADGAPVLRGRGAVAVSGSALRVAEATCYGGAPRPGLHAFVYDADHVTEHDVTDVETIAQLRTPQQTLWLDVQGLGDEGLIRRLGELFGL